MQNRKCVNKLVLCIFYELCCKNSMLGSQNEPLFFVFLNSLQELRSEGRTQQTPDSPSLKDKDGKRRSASSIAKGPTVKYAARAKQPEKLGFIRKVMLETKEEVGLGRERVACT